MNWAKSYFHISVFLLYTDPQVFPNGKCVIPALSLTSPGEQKRHPAMSPFPKLTRLNWRLKKYDLQPSRPHQGGKAQRSKSCAGDFAHHCRCMKHHFQLLNLHTLPFHPNSNSPCFPIWHTGSDVGQSPKSWLLEKMFGAIPISNILLPWCLLFTGVPSSISLISSFWTLLASFIFYFLSLLWTKVEQISKPQRGNPENSIRLC